MVDIFLFAIAGLVVAFVLILLVSVCIKNSCITNVRPKFFKKGAKGKKYVWFRCDILDYTYIRILWFGIVIERKIVNN